MKNKIIHLDCTLRDGGYYNNWFFEKDLINSYLIAMSQLKIDYVEIGFRFNEKKKLKGSVAYTSDKFLKSINIPKDLKLGVMINAGDFLEKEDKPEKIINKLFIKKNKSKISLVRIACHHHEIPKIKSIVSNLQSKGYMVGINVMQISERKTKEIEILVKLINEMKVKILYFADSLGSLNPSDIKKIVNAIKKNWKGDIGIHTHDNMGKALDNTMEAIKFGIKWVDTTVTGMGRGPGNAKTEEAILKLNKIMKKKIDLVPILNLIDKFFKPLKHKFNWGPNVYYYFAGINGVHPTFIQQMLGDPTFPPGKILKNIEYLGKYGGKSYVKELINQNEQAFIGPDTGTWKPSDYLKDRNILILGPGSNIKKYHSKIVKFIKNKKPIVLSLNFESIIDEKYINYNVASNTLRLLVDLKLKKNLRNPIIIPYNRIKDLLPKKINLSKIINFGAEVKRGIFKFNDNNAIIPNSLAISYALSIATSGKTKQIFLAGFDGYSKDNPKKNAVDEIFANYMSSKKSIKINSITPTLYNLKVI